MLPREFPITPRPHPPGRMSSRSSGISKASSNPASSNNPSDGAPPPPYCPPTPLAAAAQVLGLDVPAPAPMPSKDAIEGKSHEELSRLLLDAQMIITQQEQKLSLAAQVGNKLMEDNIVLRKRHDSLLSHIPQSPASPSWQPEVSSTPTPNRHRRRISLLSQTSPTSFGASPQTLRRLQDQNAELSDLVATLQADSNETEQRGKRTLRRLEREIDALKSELAFSQQRNEDLEAAEATRAAGQKAKQEGMTPLDLMRARRRAHQREDSADSDKMTTSAGGIPFPSDAYPSFPAVPLDSSLAFRRSASSRSVASSRSAFDDSSVRSHASSVLSSNPSAGELAIVAQLRDKCAELEEANADIEREREKLNTRLQRILQEREEATKCFEDLREEALEVGLDVPSSDESAEEELPKRSSRRRRARGNSAMIERRKASSSKDKHKHQRTLSLVPPCRPLPAPTGATATMRNPSITLSEASPPLPNQSFPTKQKGMASTPSTSSASHPAAPSSSSPQSSRSSSPGRPGASPIRVPSGASRSLFAPSSVSSNEPEPNKTFRLAPPPRSRCSSITSDTTEAFSTIGRRTYRRSLSSELGSQFGDDWAVAVAEHELASVPASVVGSLSDLQDEQREVSLALQHITETLNQQRAAEGDDDAERPLLPPGSLVTPYEPDQQTYEAIRNAVEARPIKWADRDLQPSQALVVAGPLPKAPAGFSLGTYLWKAVEKLEGPPRPPPEDVFEDTHYPDVESPDHARERKLVQLRLAAREKAERRRRRREERRAQEEEGDETVIVPRKRRPSTRRAQALQRLGLEWESEDDLPSSDGSDSEDDASSTFTDDLEVLDPSDRPLIDARGTDYWPVSLRARFAPSMLADRARVHLAVSLRTTFLYLQFGLVVMLGLLFVLRGGPKKVLGITGVNVPGRANAAAAHTVVRGRERGRRR